MESSRKPWFGRKKFGWGWGPVSWQGWLVLLGYLAAIRGVIRWFPPKVEHTDFLAGIMLTTALLLIVVVWKGGSRTQR